MTARHDNPNELEATPQAADVSAARAAGDHRGGGELPSDPEKLREEIAATREELGETVQALADKADVKARAREMIGERKRQAEQIAQRAEAQVRSRPVPFAAGAGVLAGVVIVLLLRRRR